MAKSNDKVVNFSTDNWKRYREYSNYVFWEIHEAIFILIGWPDDRGEDFIDRYEDRFDLILLPSRLKQKVGRDFVLVWNQQEKYLKQLGERFKSVLSDLKAAVEAGEIRTEREKVSSSSGIYGSKSALFLSVADLIIWCMFSNFILPEPLQSELEIYQIPDGKSTSQSRRNSIKNGIVAQYIIDKEPKITIAGICDHNWMRAFGTSGESKDKEKKGIRNDVTYSLGIKRKRGRPPEDPSKLEEAKYSPKALCEVVQRPIIGPSHYNFPLFQVAMMTAAEVVLEILGRDSILQMTEDDFLKVFLEDSIIQMYLMNDHGVPKSFATKFALEVLHQRYFHRKSLLLPVHERKKLTISQIWTIHNMRSGCKEHLDPFSNNGRLVADIYWQSPK